MALSRFWSITYITLCDTVCGYCYCGRVRHGSHIKNEILTPAPAAIKLVGNSGVGSR